MAASRDSIISHHKIILVYNTAAGDMHFFKECKTFEFLFSPNSHDLTGSSFTIKYTICT